MAKQRPTEKAWVTWSLSGSGSGLAVLVTMVSGIHPSRVRVETKQTRWRTPAPYVGAPV
jgi:hypothetical protein